MKGRLPESIELLKVGGPVGNAGLVACDLRRLPGEEKRLGWYFRVASSFEEPRDLDVSLRSAEKDRIAKLVPTTVEPGVAEPQTVTVTGVGTGRWVAELDTEDVLAVDDTAHMVVPEPRPIRIAVNAQDRFFYEHCVQAFAQSDRLMELVEEGPADITIAQGQAPDSRRAIVFHPEGDAPWWKDLGKPIEGGVAPEVVDDHPALRYTDVDRIEFAGAREVRLGDGTHVLVADARGTPLVWLARKPGRSAAVVNMKPRKARFYFSAWFPVLVHGLATHMVGRTEPLAATYQAGDHVPVPGMSEDGRAAQQGSGGEKTTVTRPSGGEETIGGARYGPLREIGFYRMANDTGTWWAGSSVLASCETLLNNAEVETTEKPIRRGYPPATWLTIFAVAVLVMEGLLYQRRKVG